MKELECQRQHSHPIEYYDPEQSGSTTDSPSSDDEAWYPGDGICPTETQLQSCYQGSLDSWSQAVLSHDGASKSLDIHLKAFLSLLDKVLPLFPRAAQDISWIGTPKSGNIATQTFNPGFDAEFVLPASNVEVTCYLDLQYEL